MDHGRGRRRSRRLTPAVIAAVGAAVLAVDPTSTVAGAPAQDDGQVASALTVEAVLSTQHDAGDHVVLRAVVAAGRLIDGHVTVRTSGSDLDVRRQLEVAGGASKELLFLVPTSDANLPDIAAVLVDGDDDVATQSIRLTRDADTDVAGVLPGLVALLPELPPRTTLPVADRRVNLVAVPAAVLELGPSALDQLDSVVATSSDLTALTATARGSLLAWVDAGGRLLLDDANDLSALPTPWQPDLAGYALAGAGEVRLVDGAARAGRWAEVLDPAPAVDEFGFDFGEEAFVAPEVTLGQRAGVRLPDLNVLVVLLAGYVLVLGPIAYLVLRRMRRLTLAWVVIPALAVVTAGAVVAAGSAWRSSGRPTANLALELHPGGATAWADVLLFNRGGGVTELGLPAGWAVDDQQVGFFSSTDVVPRTAVIDDRTTTLEASLEAGQVVVLNATGPVAAADLEVTAAADGDRGVTGTVRNPGPETLVSTAVLGRGCATSVGDLGPGETKPFALVCAVDAGFGGGAASQVWSDPAIGVGFGPPSPGVDFGLWTSFSLSRQGTMYPPGTVRVAGWVEDRPTELQADDLLGARTLVTKVVPITAAADGQVPAIAVRSSVVQYPLDPSSGLTGDGIYRFVVPPAGVGRAYRMSLPAGFGEAEVWTPGGDWVALGDSADELVIPPEAIRKGVVLVRVESTEQINIDPTLRPTIESTDG